MTKQENKGKITANDIEIVVVSQENNDDFLSLTDIAKYKTTDYPSEVIQNWMRNRGTVEFLGLWERIHNPNFNYLEFEVIDGEADLLNVALFGITAAQWRARNPNKEGNMRDHATLEQLVVLSNIESINALLIHQGLSQRDRLVQLNNTAITQMKSLTGTSLQKRLK